MPTIAAKTASCLLAMSTMPGAAEPVDDMPKPLVDVPTDVTVVVVPRTDEVLGE